MSRDDNLLKQSLNDLAPPVEEAGLWDSLQARVASARRERRRRLALMVLAAVVIAALALAAYEIARWRATESAPPGHDVSPNVTTSRMIRPTCSLGDRTDQEPRGTVIVH